MYVCTLSECISFGSYESERFGAAVGYPSYFHFQTENDVDLTELRLGMMSDGKEQPVCIKVMSRQCLHDSVLSFGTVS